MELAIDNLKKIFRVEVTKNVFGSSIVSSSTEERIKELNYLLDKNVKGIIIARGGDFLLEIIDDIDYKKIKRKNIWVEGASDPTSLLYILTTKYDLATIYGRNAKQFSESNSIDVKDNIKLIMDNNYIQNDYKDIKIESVNGNFKDSGVIK